MTGPPFRRLRYTAAGAAVGVFVVTPFTWPSHNPAIQLAMWTSAAAAGAVTLAARAHLDQPNQEGTH